MTLVERMQRYEREVVPLAARACESALERTATTAAQITHLVFATCTGFVAPGPDQQVARVLGLRADLRRLHIGFMGCQAALHGLQVADAFCRSDPEARVLLVCAELCSLHFRNSDTDEDLVANCLFADGAAAAVLGLESDGTDKDAVPLRIRGFKSCVLEDSADFLTWRIDNAAFSMGLDPGTPRVLAKSLPAFAEQLSPKREENLHWAIHPGGPAILDAAREALRLPAAGVDGSTSVLRDFGNMSSPTVLFVLDHMLPAMEPETTGAALSFGPGLSIEGMRFTR